LSTRRASEVVLGYLWRLAIHRSNSYHGYSFDLLRRQNGEGVQCSISLHRKALHASVAFRKYLTSHVVVIKIASNSEISASSLAHYFGYFTDAFYAQFAIARVWRGQQNLNTYITPYRWTFTSENECSVHRNISCEAAFDVICPIVPVEDHWKP